MMVPWQQLADDTLQGLLEEYASRDGTDYGEVEVPLEAGVAQLRAQLTRGALVIWFDPQTASTTLLTAEQALSAGSEVL